LEFSFSGLKTAVRYHIAGTGKQDWNEIDLAQQDKANIAASFEQAVVDCLVGKCMQAVRRTGLQRVCVGGGVAANSVFRSQLQSTCDAMGCEVIFAPQELCTDNAAMGALAWERIDRGDFDDLTLDVQPGLIRPNKSK
jgi:N6-L-threonylcarbamoyladenine synthase